MTAAPRAMAPEEAWAAFCGQIQTAGRSAFAEAAARDPLDRADGAAHLGALLEQALRWELRAGDPDFPRFVDINDTPEIADNLFAPVRGDAEYLLVGDVRSLFDFNISIHTNWAWLGPSNVTGDIGRSDLQIDEHGRFELHLSARPQPVNWLQLPADAAYVQIREYYADYEPRRPGLFEIYRVNADSDAPPRLAPEDLSRKLRRAAVWTRRYVAFHMDAQKRLFPDRPNTMRAPSTVRGGNSHIWYGFGRFELEDDQALLMEFDRPQARLWGVQWQRSGWFENADFYNRMTSLPGGEAHVDSDGRVRVVFSAIDAGAPNWLDTAGYKSGLFLMRWIWCERAPPVSLCVAPLAQLRGRLPRDTPVITRERRAKDLARRRSHFACRRR